MDNITQERTFMNDFWLFRKKFFEPKDDDDYWSELVDDSNALSKKYRSDYLDAIILVCVNDLEKRFRQANADKVSFAPWAIVDTVYERIKKRCANT